MRDTKGALRRRLYLLDTSRPLLRVGSTGVDWMKRNRGGFERYTQHKWRCKEVRSEERRVGKECRP